MATFKMELFGHIVYSPDLSYHDLLEREEQAKARVQDALEKAAAEFIHFEALGDILRFQCVLPEENTAMFHAICDDLAPFVANGLDARMLLVDKDLDTVYFYSIAGGKWQEGAVGLPPSGYLAPAVPALVDKIPTDHPGQIKKDKPSKHKK